MPLMICLLYFLKQSSGINNESASFVSYCYLTVTVLGNTKHTEVLYI